MDGLFGRRFESAHLHKKRERVTKQILVALYHCHLSSILFFSFYLSFLYSYIPIFLSSIPIFLYSYIPISLYPYIPISLYPYIPIFLPSCLPNFHSSSLSHYLTFLSSLLTKRTSRRFAFSVRLWVVCQTFS